MCGVISTPGVVTADDPAAAPVRKHERRTAISPALSAATRRQGRVVMPRPMLIKNALRFISLNRARFMNPSVEGV